MAKQPPHDDPKQPKSPGAEPPKPTIPNMEIDQPEEAPLEVEEVFEDDIPVVEAAPASDVAAFVLADDDVIAEEVAEAAPASEVVEVLPEEEVAEAEPLAEEEVLAEEAEPMPSDIVEAEPIAAEPASEIDLQKMFDETPTPAVAEPATPSFAALAAASAPLEDQAAPAFDAPAHDLVFEEVHAEEVVEEAAPASEVVAAEEFAAFEQPAEAAPMSDVVATEDFAHGPPASEVFAPEEHIHAAPGSEVMASQEHIAAAPRSEVMASQEHIHAAPKSEVMASQEPAPAEPVSSAAPSSGVIASEEVAPTTSESAVVAAEEAEEIAEAQPESAVVAAEEAEDLVEAQPESAVVVAEEAEDLVEAQPESAVVAAEEAEDLVEAMPESAVVAAEEAEVLVEAQPESAVVAAEEAEDLVEAMPESAVVAAEEAEEVAEAAPASDVLFDEAMVEAGPVSEAKSGEVVEELVEAVDEPSSATRKAEAVLDDEVVAAEVASGAEVFDDEATEFGEPISAAAAAPSSGTTALDTDEVEAVEEASAVDFDQTMAFEPPASAAKKSDDDELVTEEELAGTSEASAVDLGDMPARKGGSSVTGIDKVAEALESGVDVGGDSGEGKMAETVPSVQFDELLDEADEEPAKKKKKKKPVAKDDDGSTEFDAGAISSGDEISLDIGKNGKKKAKPAVKATGDDIDLDELFSEPESAESVDAEEAAEAVDAEEATEAVGAEEADEATEAEAAEAFDEEMDATEAVGAEEGLEGHQAVDEDDAKPSKKKKGAKAQMDEDEEAAALDEDEDEDASAKKAKGKKDKKGKKEKATVAPAPAQSSTFLRVFIGMFLAGFILVGAAAAGLFLAPDQVRELANQIDPPQKAPPPPPKPKLAIAHEAMDKNDYDGALAALDAATEKNEFTVKGEARWLRYLKKLGAGVPDAADPEVDLAVKDLIKGNDEVLLGQVKNTLAQKDLRADMAKVQGEKDGLDKDLKDMTAKKDTAEKKLDAAADVLVKGKHIDDKTEFTDVALAKILKALTDKEAILEMVNKILDAEVKGSGVKGLEEIVGKMKDADAKVAAVDKVLDKEKTKAKGDKGVQEIVDARNKMTLDRDDLIKTIAAAFQELVDGKIIEDKGDPRKQIIDGVKTARQKAESPLSIPLAQLGMSLGNIGTGTSKVVEQSFSTAKLATELGWFKSREAFIETPQQKMDTYVTLLQDRGQNNAKRLADIRREADWVLLEKSKSDAQAQGKAHYVQGLTLRNEEKFAEAKTAFEKALNKAGAASPLVSKSHKELIDPNEYYIPRMTKFLAAGNAKAALAEANLALKAMPTDPRLFAQRGLIRYELIRGTGPKVPEDAQKDLSADAETAGKDDALAAKSSFIKGMLEEELHHWAEAEKLYRDAIKKTEDRKAMPNEAGRYRVALTRLLLRDREETPVTPEPALNDNDKKKKDADQPEAQAPGSRIPVARAPGWSERTIVLHPWSLLIVSAVIAQPVEDPEDAETIARYKEAVEQAHKLIASDDKDLKGAGYLALGKALSKMGQRTEGLKAYAEGLRLLHPGLSTKGLKELIEQHPAFQQPDVAATPNPLMSERHFGEGMHYYWAKKYPEAEAQFRQAVKYFDKDARYQYYLGLAQLQQKTRLKRDAAVYSFETGARLEAKAAQSNPDAVREINASLERIQGELRQHLNTFRYKAMLGEPDEKKEEKK